MNIQDFKEILIAYKLLFLLYVYIINISSNIECVIVEKYNNSIYIKHKNKIRLWIKALVYCELI